MGKFLCTKYTGPQTWVKNKQEWDAVDADENSLSGAVQASRRWYEASPFADVAMIDVAVMECEASMRCDFRPWWKAEVHRSNATQESVYSTAKSVFDIFCFTPFEGEQTWSKPLDQWFAFEATYPHTETPEKALDYLSWVDGADGIGTPDFIKELRGRNVNHGHSEEMLVACLRPHIGERRILKLSHFSKLSAQYL